MPSAVSGRPPPPLLRFWRGSWLLTTFPLALSLSLSFCKTSTISIFSTVTNLKSRWWASRPRRRGATFPLAGLLDACAAGAAPSSLLLAANPNHPPQIPHIQDRQYPPALAGKLYPKGLKVRSPEARWR